MYESKTELHRCLDVIEWTNHIIRFHDYMPVTVDNYRAPSTTISIISMNGASAVVRRMMGNTPATTSPPSHCVPKIRHVPKLNPDYTP
jgi:hypothetical protein